MHRSKRLLSIAALFLCSISLAAQAPGRVLAGPDTPANLGKLKIKLLAYHDCKAGSGCYETDLKHQSDLAIKFLLHRVTTAKPGEKLALVLDIDETSLSNWDVEKQDDFGYIGKDWNDWINSAKCPAIAGTLSLFNEALKHKVSVFFITGRSEDQRAATESNLNSAGYHDWAGLALHGPHPATQTTVDYKSGERKKIVDAGYKIILNMGDQMSDLNGAPQAELSVKLPNPFYYIP
ncbi:MAG TPA: HAD family acid phosphatase [Acidobacteriaceae bacterium]|nr:HAD family acid phosphatase [Acidobacteriaceae bacterium]